MNKILIMGILMMCPLIGWGLVVAPLAVLQVGIGLLAIVGMFLIVAYIADVLSRVL